MFIKESLKTLAAVALFLLLLSRMGRAEFIYDIEGVFAPALSNPVSSSFVGQFGFPDDTVNRLEGWVELTNEPDIQRPIVLDMTLNLPATLFQPWDTRLYAGVFDNEGTPEPVTMLLVDYDQTAGTSLDATILNGGGGWDAWNVSFVDYPAGSVFAMAPVNEPAGLALLACGGVVLFGLMRSMQRN